MAKETINFIIKGGEATAAPPLAPKLGPMGVNIGQIVSEINKKTEAMKGINVPIKLIVDTSTKEFEIKVGTPPVSALIKKELRLEKGSSKPKTEKIADMSVDRVIKIARTKSGSLLAGSPAAAVKEILGTCVSLGVLVGGRDPREIQKEIDQGAYADKIAGKEELRFESDAWIEAKKAEFATIVEERKKQEAAEAAAKEAAEIAAKAEVAVEEKAELPTTEEKVEEKAKEKTKPKGKKE